MNILRNPKLDRRTLLRGAGTIAIALPWLEIMGTPKVSNAQAAGAPKRFLSVYQPGGTVKDQYWPTGTADAPVLSRILQPLEPIFPRVLVLKGLSMDKVWKKQNGEQHQAGIVSWLTGTPQPGGSHFPVAPSLDQVLATKISKGIKAKASLQMAIRWATGSSYGLMHPINTANFEDAPGAAPIPPQLDPKDVFNNLFGSTGDTSDPNVAIALARQKSILDYVGQRLQSLSARLGASDKAKLDQHLTKVRELEMSLDKLPAGMSCAPPTLIDTTGYNPTTGLKSGKDETTDAKIPEVGKFMMDMMVMALGCDITAVGSFQWTDTEAKHTFPWLGLSEHHHFYQHDGGFRPEECARIGTWYAEQHAYLLQALQKVDMGGHSLLDETVVFFGSELADPPSHAKDDMPFLVAGGGIRGGRLVDFQNIPHNNLLVALHNMYGEPQPTFGDAEFCQNPISGLT